MADLKITQMLMPASKYALKCPYSMSPKYIVVHNTANDASAMSEISYMEGNSSSTSFHYAVDDTRAVQGIPLSRNAWHAGDGANGKGNRYGIAVEICYSKSGGADFVAAEKNAAILVAKLLQKYGWSIDKVTKHQDYSGKYCPHRTLDQGWARFVNMIKGNMPKPEQKPSAQSSSVAAGSKLKLQGVSAYESSTAKNASSKKTGTFYAWSKEAVNKRIRITNTAANVGKAGKVTCWINLSDAQKSVSGSSSAKTGMTPYSVKVALSNLIIRSGPGVNNAKMGYTGEGVFTIVEETTGPIDTQGTQGKWGKLKSGAGWIALKYATKI